MELSARDLATLAMHDIWTSVLDDDIDAFVQLISDAIARNTERRVVTTYTGAGVRAGLMTLIVDKIKETQHG